MRLGASPKSLMRSAAAYLLFSLLLPVQSQPPSPTPTKDSQGKQDKTSVKDSGPNPEKNPLPRPISVRISDPVHIAGNASSGQPNQSASTDGWIAAFTFALVVFSALQFWAMHRQAQYMREGLALSKQQTEAAVKTADAATLSATTAKRSIELLERADVRAETIKINTPEDFKFIAGDTVISIVLVNHGRTRAERVSASVLVFMGSESEVRRPIIDPTPTMLFDIPPNASRDLHLGAAMQWLTMNDLARIATGEDPYIRVKVEYRDIFGNDRWTETGGHFAPPTGWLIREHSSN